MSRYKQTYNCIFFVDLLVKHVKSQDTLKSLQSYDPRWCDRRVWITFEPAFESQVLIYDATGKDLEQWHKHSKGPLNEQTI